MRIYYYLFDKLIYNYTETNDGVEIRRNDGKNIDVDGKLESNSNDDKTYIIYAYSYNIIEDFETNMKLFLVYSINSLLFVRLLKC